MTTPPIHNFIDGSFATEGVRDTFVNRSPIDGQPVSIVHSATKEDVDRAVQAAKRALKGPWGKTTMNDRAELLYAIADEMDRRFDDFLAAEVADTGKPHSLASRIDIPRGAANFKSFADIIRVYASELFQTQRPGIDAINYSVRVPKGVIGVICPWNLPLLLMTWKVAPALASGNTVVVKPSEETPSTATLLAEVFRDVGVPDGVYNVVHGFGPEATGQWLCEHPDVDAITFTGETVTGSAIMQAASHGIRDVSFELGGKNAALIFADCDLEKAVAGTLRSVFDNCGQVCLQTERVYVERPIFDEFVRRMVQGAQALNPGLPDYPATTMGPLVSHGHREKVLAYFQKAVDEGAVVQTGGGVPEMPESLQGGAWIEPTIWTGLGEDASVVREEIFGPCCHIQPFDDEDHAIAMANDTQYGLAATVWTENLSRAHRVAHQLEVGTCWVNSWYLRDLRVPFGGAKQSGIGREGGVHSLEFYTELRNVCIKL